MVDHDAGAPRGSGPIGTRVGVPWLADARSCLALPAANQALAQLRAGAAAGATVLRH